MAQALAWVSQGSQTEIAVQVPLIGRRDAITQAYTGLPSQSGQAAGVEQFTRRPIGLGHIMPDFPLETHDIADHAGEFQDRDISAAAHVDVLRLGIMLGKKNTGIGGIVNMQELAARGSASPDLYAGRMRKLRLMRLSHECRQDMRRGQREIVAGTIQVGRHCRNEITTTLPAIGLTQLDSDILGDRIPLIGRFERTCQQGLFAHRLFGQLGVDQLNRPENDEMTGAPGWSWTDDRKPAPPLSRNNRPDR